MRLFSRMFLVCSLVGAVVATGCLPGIKSLRSSTSPDSGTTGKTTAKPALGQESSTVPDKELQKLLAPPPPPPSFKQGTEDTSQIDKAGFMVPLDKEEVNDAALKFAREVPNVKFVKTCYSKIYGGWYLLLYIEKGKKTSLQQYSWNAKSREWEVVYHIKEIPANQLEFHLKGEVGDEKCFVLKK